MEIRDRIAQELAQFQPDLRYRDEAAGVKACRLALTALRRGDYGIGALVLDQSHHVWAQGGNRMLSRGLDSAGHAEMRVLDQFERLLVHPPPREMILMVTLEPCPMCLTRALYAGIGEVVYLVEDAEGGMVYCRDRLPPSLAQLATLSRFRLAEVSPTLRRLAERLSAAELADRRAALLDAQRLSRGSF